MTTKNATTTTKGKSKGSKSDKGAAPATKGNAKLKAQSAPATKGKGAVVLPAHANGALFTPHRPGVLARMTEALANAKRGVGVSKGEILAHLTKFFPERDSDAMKRTVAMQVPSGLRIEKGIVCESAVGADGVKRFWVDMSAPRLPKGERHVNPRPDESDE